MKRAAAVVVLVIVAMTSIWVPASASPGSTGTTTPASAVPSALPSCTSAPFTDVPVSHPFCAEIKWAVDNGITTGYPGNTFRPADLVARQAVAAFLWRIEDSPAPANTGQFFADVSSSHPFFNAIQWMGQTGMSTGSANPNGGLPLFKPGDPISRQAMAAFLWRLADSPPPAATGQVFADVASSHPFFNAIQWMGQIGMSTGSPNPDGGLPYFKPGDSITRQATMAFLARFESRNELRVPSAPNSVTAAGNDASAVVAWNAPPSTGGSPITSYVVTATPGNKTCTWTSGPLTCTVNALTNGTTYTFTVRAHNAVGDGPASAGATATPSAHSFRLFYVRPSGSTAVAARPAQIKGDVNAARNWFAGQLGGKAPRVSSSGGQPAVTSVVLPWTQAQIDALPDAQASINSHLNTTYSLAGQKMAIWLEGSVEESYCGVWNGTSMFMPMDNCEIYPSETASFPYGGTYLFVHELTHALGAVQSCAPHADGTGHVNDDVRDVLYQGPLARDWNHLTLDPGRDDYYFPVTPGACPSIGDSPHLGPLALP